MEKVLERKIKLIELEKTQEQKEFEKKHHCFLFLISDNYVDSWIKITTKKHKINYELVKDIYFSLSLRARMNNLEVRFVWLPYCLANQIKYPEEANKCFNLIKKYSKKL